MRYLTMLHIQPTTGTTDHHFMPRILTHQQSATESAAVKHSQVLPAKHSDVRKPPLHHTQNPQLSSQFAFEHQIALFKVKQPNDLFKPEMHFKPSACTDQISNMYYSRYYEHKHTYTYTHTNVFLCGLTFWISRCARFDSPDSIPARLYLCLNLWRTAWTMFIHYL